VAKRPAAGALEDAHYAPLELAVSRFRPAALSARPAFRSFVELAASYGQKIEAP
jgi:hypothetical protein